MQLIIPMSGIGSRFLKAGYKIPKPLIEVENQSIISHVVDMFPTVNSISFICNEDHLNDPILKMREKLLEINSEAKIISINPHKKGPIYAIIKAIDYLNYDSPIIVNYCDFNCLWNFEEFNKQMKSTQCDGCVVTYTGFHPHMLKNTNYAYVKTKGSEIKDIQEKKPFTSSPMNEFASTGTYYFKSLDIMRKYFEKAIQQDLSIKNEFYVSLSFKPMINDNLNLRIFNIDYFMQWGTPEDLSEFKWFSNLFTNKIKEATQEDFKLEGTLIMPCAGKGERFIKEGYKLPKPLIEVSNKPMLIQAINDLNIFNKKKIIIRENLEKKDILVSKVKKYFPEAEITTIKKITNGQAETCLFSLNKKEMEHPIMISACDNGVLYNKQKLKNLISDKTIDIVVFGFRGFPGAIKNPEMYGWIEEKENIIKNIYVKKKYKDPSKDPIIIGTFYFKKGKIFKEITKELIETNSRVNNEFYVDSAINFAINKGYKVVLFETNSYLCWGTPSELKTFNYWQNCFDRWSKHSYKKELDEDFNLH